MQKDEQKLWSDNSELIRQYFQYSPQYEDLASEVDYILTKVLAKNGIKVSSIAHRVKSLESFLNKIERKMCRKPFEEMTDISGVRVTCLYREDVAQVTRHISKTFAVVEQTDNSDVPENSFGYAAVHLLVRLGSSHGGPRYADLHDLVCEIQIRTLLQSSWAEISHHLMYKKELEVPKQLRRQVHALAALLENADCQFSEINKKRQRYVGSMQQKSRRSTLLSQELSTDSLRVYATQKFPHMDYEYSPGQGRALLEKLRGTSVATIADIDDAIGKTKDIVDRYMKEPGRNSATSNIMLALALVDRKFRPRHVLSSIGTSYVMKHSAEFDI